MIPQSVVRKITDYIWEIPKGYKDGMQVPARFYAKREMFDVIFKDRSLDQLVNVAHLPGIQKYAIAMPDMHEGYASPIGGVAGIDAETGIIAPGMTGYDINCGVRLIKTPLFYDEIKNHLDALATQIQKDVPSGLGKGRNIKLSNKEMDEILEGGAPLVIKKGYGIEDDIESCENNGFISWADSSCVSSRAKDRGKDQFGTLGSGNHFLEVQRVDEVFDEKIATIFGLKKDQVVIMVHCGSRGVGHQVCSDYLREFIPLMENKYKIKVPDREFACVPFRTEYGQRYFKAMAAAANFAFANRQFILHYIRKSWQKIIGGKYEDLKLLYDVAHNIVKKEKYIIDGKEKELIIHRKGATRAFPPGNEEIPAKYRETGQPVLIPGSMGTASYVLVGVETGEQSFFTTCHGAGRTMSRHQAIRTKHGRDVVKDLEEQGIIVKCWSFRGIAEEAPYAYKDIENVVDVVHNAGLSKKVARLRPIAVVKGE